MRLDQVFKEFIQVVQENPNYTIGLIDAGGNVISCSLAEKIGLQLVIDRNSPEDYFYEIRVKGRDFGYLWVNSQEPSVAMVANLLSESLKTRIIYELNQESARKSLSTDDRLIKELIDDKHFDLDAILELMKTLHFDSSLARVAINIINDDGFDKEEITGLKYKINENDSVYSLLEDNQLLIFKAVPKDLFELSLREYLEQFILDLQDWGLTDCYYLIGTVQRKIRLYAASYGNCRWLKRNITLKKDQAFYFQDHIFNYFASNLPSKKTAELFDYYCEKAEVVDIDELIRIADQLYLHDYNITQTADSLFLHKNTLIYKIKRYEELFDLDLRGSFQGKILFYLLADFFRENKKRKQVGAKL